MGKKQITAEDIVAVIESGDTTLKSLHEQLSEKFYYMVEEYWLYEADNECIRECLWESFNEDVKSGIYPPVSFEDFIEWFETGDIDSSEKLSFWGDLEDMYFDGDKEDLRKKYDEYIYSKYYEWIGEHDHEFAAKRVGLNLDACRDDEVDYTINLEK